MPACLAGHRSSILLRVAKLAGLTELAYVLVLETKSWEFESLIPHQFKIIMKIFLESDVERDNDAIIAQIQKIIPDAADVFVKIRSQRQSDLLRQFDSALDEGNREKAKLALEQFEQTLYATDGTTTMKLLRIQFAGCWYWNLKWIMVILV